ncbi:IQ domain-containing protein E-like [Biomphalaria glabrata]|uniref:IQ domain-containing protein E-like n=1 Tax=Biomphalaria glabrata TaxID=6526 RepID=A0A9W2ZJQ6_BIOGL|nr:IQ domain-containing protein E-like [Biomphalaria glabrata]
MADVISRNISSPTPAMQKSKKSARRTPRRPVTPGKNKTGKDLWMAAIKKRQTLTLGNGYRPTNPKHKTTTEFFIDTLRRTGVGISAETNKNQSMSGLPRGNTNAYPYLSTSHFIRQVVGVESSPRVDSAQVRTNAGTPAYKTPEEYYDEVLTLRKHIAALTLESNTQKTRIRRLEEDNQKKEKEIEGLLNPDKNSELRRTIGDRKADSGAVLHSYKQKILKLETQLKSQESAYSKLQSDLKTTKIDEMRVQLEVLYSELVRLQMMKDSTGSAEKSSPAKETSAKVKALSETVIRLSKTNEQLQAENKSLKDDLNRLMEESDTNLEVKKDYADMNRKELLKTINALEQKIAQAELGMFEKDDGSVRSYGTPRRVQGKMDLKGSLEDRLQQLDERETQLLQEVSRLQTIVKRERDKKDEKHTSSLPPTPRKRQSLVTNEEKIAQPLRAEKSSRPNSSRRSEAGSRPGSSRSREEKVENFQQKHAATSIQRLWKKRQQEKTDKEVQAFRENLAAKRIQHGWLEYKQRHIDEDLDDAACVIQGTLKGHYTRHKFMVQPDYTDDDVYLIQSSLRGHRVRTRNLRNMRNVERMDSDLLSLSRQSSPTYRPPTAQRKTSIGSRGSAAQFGSQVINSGRRTSPSSRPSSASMSRRKSSQIFQARYDAEADDDDDIMT